MFDCRSSSLDNSMAFDSSYQEGKEKTKYTLSTSDYENQHRAILALIDSLGNWIGHDVDFSSDHCDWLGVVCYDNGEVATL